MANRSMFRGWLLRVVGLVALVVGSAIDYASLRQIREAIGWLGGAATFMIGAGLLVVGSSMWSRGKKQLARGADEALLRDPRPPVVYLRSFLDDTTAARPVSPPIFGWAQLVGVHGGGAARQGVKTRSGRLLRSADQAMTVPNLVPLVSTSPTNSGATRSPTI
jgi:hypothetical protein